MIQPLVRRVLFLCVPGLLGCLHGCSLMSSPKPDRPRDDAIRAIWVTRFDYGTPEDITRIMDNVAGAGFNTVLFQVRGNGTVAYPSRYEPWSRQFDFRHPGFDPLAVAIREAHRRGLELHAWINVMPAWRGPGEPPMRSQLYHARPEWFWYDANGIRQPTRHEVDGKTRDWYVSLNPCLPEVRNYLTRLCREIVNQYPVDGLHLDYIRFPNEPVIRGEKIPDYPRDARTLALFRDDSGGTPEANPDQWNRWRTEQVTRLVAQISTMLAQEKPAVKLSAAVGSVAARGLTHFQDAPTWIQRDLVDIVFLMNYTSSPDKFRARIEPWLPMQSWVTIVPGLWVKDEPDVAGGAEAAAREIAVAREMTGGFCFFAYASLFDGREGVERTRPIDQDRNKRAIRRSILVPAIERKLPGS